MHSSPVGGPMVRVEMLGPVQMQVDECEVALGGDRSRALVAVLALMCNRIVSSERLIEELWGERPPGRPRESLQMHVVRVRRALIAAGADSSALVSRSGGYLLRLEPGARDLDDWERALVESRGARAAGDLELARHRLREALGLWRGDPIDAAIANGLLGSERGRLNEERLRARIDAIELDLDQGHHEQVLGELEALVITHPFHERLVGLQMLALYRSDRQAEALDAFHTARARFVTRLGIEPGRPLRELHGRVLNQCPTLSFSLRGAHTDV